jgi:hypothetical protein
MSRSALSLALVALLAACGSPSAADDAGGGGSGGSGGASGGASGGSPPLGSGSTPGIGSGSTPGMGGDGERTNFTAEEWQEWQEALAPRSGAHEVWTQDECQGERLGASLELIEPEYRVVPTEHCYVTPTYPTDKNHQCTVLPYCESSADCTEEPRGRCEGEVQQAYCHYPLPLPQQCESSAECTAAPEGFCPEAGGQFQSPCYPNGVCLPPVPHCSYPSLHEFDCQTDADCDAIAGGECVLPIRYATCRYDTCFEDADCADGDRCACGTCTPADCDSSDDCSEGESCELSSPNCGRDWSIHCTTPEDECAAGDDEPYCIYDGASWSQDDVICG